MIVIQVEKVPQKIIDAADTEQAPGSMLGVTICPTDHGPPFRGFRKITIYIREKMGQYRTRQVICHELIHVAQYLTGCSLDERHANELDEVLVAALVPQKKEPKESGEWKVLKPRRKKVKPG